MSLSVKIHELSLNYLNEIREIRRHLHQYPELSFHEFQTSGFIQSKLNEWNVPFEAGFVQTGIVARLEGKNPSSKIIALRADMDALPIQEKNDVSYRSRNEGVMHACGHDVHTSCLLGAIRILQQIRDEWEGTLIFIFQPGEEKLPGGAKLMIEEGVLQKFGVQKIIAQHVFPEMGAGNVGFRAGMYMASTDELYLTVKGRGGHAALPSGYINPIMITAEILLQLQKEFEKSVPADSKAVLAFGKIVGLGATNVIPSEVKLEGTLRTLDESFRKSTHKMLQDLSSSIASKLGGEAELIVMQGYPVLYNNEELTKNCLAAASEFLGEAFVHPLDLRMTAEDFSYFSREIPACFYRLGTGNKELGIVSSVHTPTFDIDEQALQTGMGLLAYLAINA